MQKGTVWTILGVIFAIVIAWALVNILFSLLAFVIKLLLVAAVAIIVFFVMRAMFARGDDTE